MILYIYLIGRERLLPLDIPLCTSVADTRLQSIEVLMYR